MTDARLCIAVYDACVFYPNYLRDILVQLAANKVIQAKWTEQIHTEWMRNVLKNRPSTSREKLQKLKQLINLSTDNCLVTDFESLIPSLTLPDVDDLHVLAAAIAAKADIIVTFNLKDFPESVLAGYGIAAQHPDDFLAYLVDLDPSAVVGAVQTIQNRLTRPPVRFDEYMEILLKQGLPRSVSMLRQFQIEMR